MLVVVFSLLFFLNKTSWKLVVDNTFRDVIEQGGNYSEGGTLHVSQVCVPVNVWARFTIFYSLGFSLTDGGGYV